jgi:hypothetical protein
VADVGRLEIAPLMRVRLVADEEDFVVQEVSTRDQYVRPGQVARWDFGVTPLRSGRRQLGLMVSIRLKVEGGEEVFDLPSYQREVLVAVAPLRATGRFVGANWKWIAGAIVIPFLVWASSQSGAGDAALGAIRGWLGIA